MVRESKNIDKEYIEELEKNKKWKNKKSFFERLNPKQTILVFAIILVLLIIGNSLISKLDVTNTLNYNNISAEKIIESSTIDQDRETYWRINTILKTVIAADPSSQDDVEGSSNTAYTYDDYYNYLVKNYKNKISKYEFKKKMSDIVSTLSSKEVPVDKIYRYKNNTDYYLVQLKSSDENKKIYIGFELINEKNAYYIFYAE